MYKFVEFIRSDLIILNLEIGQVALPESIAIVMKEYTYVLPDFVNCDYAV